MSNSIASAIVDGQTITVGAYFQLGDAMGQDVSVLFPTGATA